jgi:hypothetical protein
MNSETIRISFAETCSYFTLYLRIKEYPAFCKHIPIKIQVLKEVFTQEFNIPAGLFSFISIRSIQLKTLKRWERILSNNYFFKFKARSSNYFFLRSWKNESFITINKFDYGKGKSITIEQKNENLNVFLLTLTRITKEGKYGGGKGGRGAQDRARGSRIAAC